MRKINNNEKKGFLKKIFVKICRIIGYEIIDQKNFHLPVSGKNSFENFSTLGKNSISIPLGITKITRPVKSLEIFIKTCTSVNLVTQNKKRVFECEKSEYTFRTIKSLINNFKLNTEILEKINLKITIIDHKSKNYDLNLIKKLLEQSSIKYEIINLDVNEFSFIKTMNKNNPIFEDNMKATMASILKSFKAAKDSSADLVYFVEDDYIHKKDSLSEMIFTYEKLASVFKKDLFLCPVDYPYLYKEAEPTNVFIGHKYHWRRVRESLLTFMTNKKMIEKYWNELIKMSETEHSPFETPLHEIYEEEICLSPIPSLAIHCTNVNSVFGLSPNIDWKKIWEDSKV
ncbi:MAG: glycosyltransferase family 2 protein [Pelagibacteraceae bacterium]